MKILHIIGALSPGGAEVLLADLCKNVNRGISLSGSIKVEVIANRTGVLEEELKKHGVKVTIISRKGFDVKFIRKLRNYVIENQVDVIHSHSGLNSIHAVIASSFMGVKNVLTVHGHSLYNYRFLRFFVYTFLDKILFVSGYLKTFFVGVNDRNINKYLVHYNGIDSKKFNHVNPLEQSHLNLPDNAFVAGMVGNFNNIRDHLTVCKAVNLLLKGGLDFHFIFVGGAQGFEFEEECKRYCEKHHLKDHVHFLGSRQDIPKILATLDLFVYSSNRDTFGIAVVEAMMSGTPVIVNDLPVFQEITDNGKYAQLYKTKDADDLAEKIEYFISHPDKRSELGERGRKWALENYTIEKHIEQLHSIYTELLTD